MKKLLQLCVAALIVINVFELSLYFKARRESDLYGDVVRFPLPSGYLLDKTFMRQEPSRCFLLRLSSDGCPSCRLDQPQYKRLVNRAQRNRCKMIVIAPKVGDMKLNPDNGGVLQLQYIDMNFGRLLVPFATPETILLDGAGRRVWDWEGAMNDRASEGAQEAISRIR